MKKKYLLTILFIMVTFLTGCNKTDINKYEGTVIGNKQAPDVVENETTDETVEATFGEPTVNAAEAILSPPIFYE